MAASRIASRLVLVFAVVLSVGACRRDRCLSVCQQRQHELGCQPMESCKETCDKLHEASPCAGELRGWEDCIVKLPTKQWRCDEAGQPAPLPGACPEARSKVELCIARPPGTPPAAKP